MKLWLVRHGPPLVEQGICYGATDVPADPHATLRLAQELAATLPPGLAATCSPLRRCTQLADALHAVRADLAWRADARLAEMDFGAWEGRRWDAIGRAEFDHWTADFAAYRCGGGESVAQLMGRVALALQDARAAGGDALWLTHAGVIRAARLLVAGVAVPRTAADWPREGPDFGQLVCFDMVLRASG
jgi:alpha-ribazole phosphatase